MAKKKANMMEWYGSAELLRELEQAGGNVNEAIRHAVKESFKPIVRELHQFTGQKHNITGATENAFVEDYGKWTKKNNLTVRVGYNVGRTPVKESGEEGKLINGLGEAAIFLQVGTPKMAPYFFLTSAYHDREGEVIEAQTSALRKVISDMLDKVPSKGK